MLQPDVSMFPSEINFCRIPFCNHHICFTFRSAIMASTMKTRERSTRKDVKRAWLGIKMLINLGDCTQVELKQLESTEKDFLQSLIQPSTEAACLEDVLQRRLAFENSDDMQEILRLFWFVVSQHRDTVTNELTKSGYIQFNLCVQR